MFIKDLREATMSAHQQLDKMLIPHIKGAVTDQQYADLLKCFYGYFTAIENKLATQLNDTLVPAFSQRRKSAVIVSELQDMGIDANLPLATDTPEIDSIAKAFGSMYVLEGSTLGGKIISKILAGNLNKDTEQLRFFNFYGADTDKHWADFVTALNTYADTLSETEKNDMLNAATDTFMRFKSWIELTYLGVPVSE